MGEEKRKNSPQPDSPAHFTVLEAFSLPKGEGKLFSSLRSSAKVILGITPLICQFHLSHGDVIKTAIPSQSRARLELDCSHRQLVWKKKTKNPAEGFQ